MRPSGLLALQVLLQRQEILLRRGNVAGLRVV
jgi:hypothetical protein